MLHSRMKRVEEMIQQELAKILAYDLQDPRVRMASPSQVKVSKDLREAVVHISLLEDDPDVQAEAMEALESAKGYIKRLLADRVRLKRLPDPHFKLDTTCRDAFELFKVMDQVETLPLEEDDETR